MNDRTKWENAHFEHDAHPVDGIMSKPAAAQDAVAWVVPGEIEAARRLLDLGIADGAAQVRVGEAVEGYVPLYAAPVAAAPVERYEVQTENGPLKCSLAVYSEWQKNEEYIKRLEASTPAAPGIDLEQFRPLMQLGMTYGPGSSYRIAAESLADLIDASPKGVTMHNDGSSEAQFIADAERLNCTVCGGSGHVDDTPKGGSNVVSEYIAARDAYEEAVKPSGGFGQPKRLCHSDPIILRYRNARTALNALQATSAEVGS